MEEIQEQVGEAEGRLRGRREKNKHKAGAVEGSQE